jgi:KEOPS complex subunit Cgi121
VRLVEGIAAVGDLDAFLGSLSRIGEETDCTVQAFDARYVVDRAHLDRARELADRAIDRGENVARDRGVEIMLYAAGRRQIDRALALGVSEGEGPVVVLVAADPSADDVGDEAAAAAAVADLLTPADTLGKYNEALVREYFDVGDTELAATAGTLAEMIHERVALLDVRK